MNLKISMCTSACIWDNDLVNQKEGQMKPITAIGRGQSGYDHTSIIRPCGSGVSLAGVDPDFGFGPFLGAYGPGAAASRCQSVDIGLTYNEGERKHHGRGNVH